MQWDPSARGYDLKHRRIERAHELLERGRLCTEARCITRSVVAVTVYIGRHAFEAGLCRAHHRRLLRELEERGRPHPDGTLRLGRLRIGASRLVAPGEVLSGPLTPGELDDE